MSKGERGLPHQLGFPVPNLLTIPCCASMNVPAMGEQEVFDGVIMCVGFEGKSYEDV